MKRIYAICFSILMLFTCVACGGTGISSRSINKSRRSSSIDNVQSLESSQLSSEEVVQSSSLTQSSSSSSILDSSSILSSSETTSSSDSSIISSASSSSSMSSSSSISSFSSSSSSLSSSSMASSSSVNPIPPEDPMTEVALDYIDVSASGLTAYEQEKVDSIFYQNTNQVSGADPACVWVEEDGYFYMYATGHDRFTCFRSRNLTEWEKLPDAMNQPRHLSYSSVSSLMSQAEFNTYVDQTWLKHHYLWAPAVIYDADLDLYLMFFSARYTNADPIKLQLCLATSKTPNGPFIQWTGTIPAGQYANGQTYQSYTVDYSTPFIDFEKLNGINGNYPYEGYIKAIDIEPFIDPATGDKYIYFVRDLGDKYTESSVMGMKMIDWFTPDYSTLTLLTKPNFTHVTDLTANPYGDEGDVNEGPFVIYNEDSELYYLTYSVNGYWDKSYSVKQAVAPTPLGPFEKITSKAGGRILNCESDWMHRAGTGHHVFTRAGDELFIVYHMHTNPEKLAGYDNFDRQRCIVVDRINWVENDDGILIMNAGGPSYDYRALPQVISGYSNLAPLANVTVNQSKQNTNTKYLNDGAIQIHVNEGVHEFEANKAPLIVTMEFDNPITLKGITVTNSWELYSAFEKIEKIEIEYSAGGKKYLGYTDEILFDWDRFYNNNIDRNGFPMYIPGCGSSAIFNDIRNVSKIRIYIENQPWDDVTGLHVSEITVLGK